MSFPLLRGRGCLREPAGFGKYLNRVNLSQSFQAGGGTNGGGEVLKRRGTKRMRKYKSAEVPFKTQGSKGMLIITSVHKELHFFRSRSNDFILSF